MHLYIYIYIHHLNLKSNHFHFTINGFRNWFKICDIEIYCRRLETHLLLIFWLREIFYVVFLVKLLMQYKGVNVFLCVCLFACFSLFYTCRFSHPSWGCGPWPPAPRCHREAPPPWRRCNRPAPRWSTVASRGRQSSTLRELAYLIFNDVQAIFTSPALTLYRRAFFYSLR